VEWLVRGGNPHAIGRIFEEQNSPGMEFVSGEDRGTYELVVKALRACLDPGNKMLLTFIM